MIGDCEFRAVQLPGDRSVTEVMLGFGDDEGAFCLRGDWAGGSDLLGSEPISIHSGQSAAGRTDPLSVLHRQPRVSKTTGPLRPGSVGGGWFGILDYPTGRRLHGLSDVAQRSRDQVGPGPSPGFRDQVGPGPSPGSDGPVPASWLAFYDHLLRWDRNDKAWWFESLWTPERAAALDRRRRELAARIAEPAARPGYRAGPFAGADPIRHLQAVERCIGHIRAGDIFQVNAALRLDAEFDGSALHLFADVSEQLQPAYAAYVDTGATVLAGLSPELFLRRCGRVVTTSPIKGTRPRTGAADEHEADILRGSTKDAAENVMIVDLMRNDLGRVCRPGSVQVPRLLEIQPHPGVWHLVSTVTGELRDEVDDADLLSATFPPGSVTGAPKTRAMQIIDQYESAPRRAFTGAVGFSSPLYGAEWSVTIRSFEITGKAAGRPRSQISLWVGGGITVDSVPVEEWRECLTKAWPLLQAAGFQLVRPARPDPAQANVAAVGPDVSTVDGLPLVGSDIPTVDGLLLPDPDFPITAGGLLETVLIRDGHPVGLADHLARLERSCRELYGCAPPVELAAAVARNAVGHRSARLRIVATPHNGLDLSVTVVPLTGPTGVRRLVAMPRPGGVWRHKYADRRWLIQAEERAGADRLPLFVSSAGRALETSRGNIFLVESDQLVTPPATDSILPGVTRRMVLDIAFDLDITIRIEPIPLARIHAAAGLFSTSAISGITHIDELDGSALPAAGALESAITAAALAYE